MKVEISGIVKKYGRNNILNKVNICAESGMCIGLAGINGSGKSTLFNILAGISSCDAGSFCYDGVDLLKNRKLISKIIGYVPQTPPLIEELSCLDNLKLWYSNKDIKEQLDNGVLQKLGIDSFLKMKVGKISGGMKKRLAIACAVADNPQILIMDEPSAALDLIGKKAVEDYITYFKSIGGIVILSTHDVAELSVCDKVYVLCNGIAKEYLFDGDVDKLIGCINNDNV